ncbi:MAG: HD domain-containing protein [Spirochaetes bacterium]|nr:HD domain-containing protein [Spirochaetota bacterium]
MKYKDEYIIKNLKTIFNKYRLYFIGLSALEFFYHKNTFNYFIISDIDIVELYKNQDSVYKLDFEPFDYAIKFNDIFVYLRIYKYNSLDDKIYLQNFYKHINHPLLLPFFYDLHQDILYDFYSFGAMYKGNKIYEKIILDFDDDYKIYSLFYFNRFALLNDIKKDDESFKKNINVYFKDIEKYKNYIFNCYTRSGFINKFAFIYFILIDRFNYYLLRLLDSLFILKEVFPDLYKLKEVYHNKENHPEGDAFEHSLRTLRYLRSNDFVLNFSVLFHDIGKYEVKDIKYRDGERDWKFPYHSKVGVNKALNIIANWKKYLYFYEKLEERITYLIGNHMIISYIDKLDDKEVSKIINNNDINNLVKLYKSDLLSSMSELTNYKKIVSFLKRKGLSI